MNKRLFILLFLIVYLAFHVFTLGHYPLPWFDETYYASVSLSYLQHSTFVPQVVATVINHTECLMHGPVYYFLGALSFKLFGFGVFQFRLVNFSFGLLAAIILWFILKKYTRKSPLSSTLIILLFLVDPFYNICLHEGRMDLTAICFALIAWLLVIDKEKTVFYFLSGLMAAIAVLTTPRVSIIVLGIFLIVVLYSIKNKGFKKTLIVYIYWFVPFISLLLVWLFFAFGTFDVFLAYYKEVQQGLHSANTGYVGGTFYIPKHQYLLIAIAFATLIYGIVSKGYAFLFKIEITVSLCCIGLFYFIVRDLGPYSALILPFYYLILSKGYELVESKKQLIYSLPIFLLIGFNSLFFILKSSQVVAELNERNPQLAYDFVAKNIPKNAKVIGDPMYYYAVTELGAKFEYADLFSTPEHREQVLREQYDYDYLIVSCQFKNKRNALAAYYLSKSTLIAVDSLTLNQSKWSRKISRLGLFSPMENEGYSAVIYKRIK